jgi:hypothetical protein
MSAVYDQAESKYRSRTLWLVVGLSIIATALTWTGKIDGAGWITTVLGLFTGWQVRRYGDNKLRNGGE